MEGSFDCSDNQLDSFKGAPAKVIGLFNAANNKITSLEGIPEAMFYNLAGNTLSTLELIKTLLVNGEMPEEYLLLANAIMPDWWANLKAEGIDLNEDDDDDLLKALEKVSK